MGMSAHVSGRYGLILVAIMVAACVGYTIAIWATGIDTEVMNYRYGNAQEIFSGTVPATEYPPLALVFIALPMVFADTPFGYNVAFIVEMLIFMVAGLFLSSKLATDLGRDAKQGMLLYTVLMILMLEFVLDRFDVIPAVMTLGALHLFLSGRREWAFLLLALGTLTKLYPALLFPVLIILLWFNGERRDMLRGALVFIGTGAVAVAVCMATNPDLITGFMGYHGDRPLQIESVASSLVYLLSIPGLTDVWIQSAMDPGSFLSDNLRGPLPDAVASMMMPVMVAAIIGVCVLYAWKRRSSSDDGMRLAALAMLGCLMAFVVFNKVFSSQYLIWLIPSVLFVLLVSDERLSKRLNVSVLAMFVLTQVNFAYNVGYLGGGANIGDLGMMVILARNLVAVYILYLCISGIVLDRRQTRPADADGVTFRSQL